MKIENFKKYFIDYIDECNEVGVPAKISLNNIDIFPNKWVAVYGYKIVDNKMILLTTEDWESTAQYEFTDKNIFNNIEEVVFLVNNDEISDCKFEDTS